MRSRKSPPPPPSLPPDDDVQLISDDGGEETEEAARKAAEEADAKEEAAAASQPISPSEDVEDDEDKLEVDVDVDADRNELEDETADEGLWGMDPVEAPEGFSLALKPSVMPTSRSLIKRTVLWAIPVARNGAPAWIRSVVDGGPLTPSSALLGVTMRLRCTLRLDKATPSNLLREPVEVALNLENYGRRWFLLEEIL